MSRDDATPSDETDPHENQSLGYGPPDREDEVSLLDILLVLVRHSTLIVRTVLAFALLGMTYALLSTTEYTSEAVVLRESKEGGGGLPSGIPASALSGLGISLGGASSGLTPSAFPEVLQSREVRTAVVRDTFRFPDTERSMTFVEYINRPPGWPGEVLNYTLWLPWTLKDALSDTASRPGITASGRAVTPSEQVDQALEAVEEMVVTSVDEETGLMTISVTAGSPTVASDLAGSFVDHLTDRVREIRTENTRRQLSFVNERFQEAEEELEAAEDRLAQFLERNQNPTSASLQFRRDRLQRQVRFKEQLYSDLQGQLTQTRLDLQRRQPVTTVVEKPVPPMNPSNLSGTTILIIALIFGGAFGVLGALLREALSNEESEEKIAQIVESTRVRKVLSFGAANE